MKRARQIAGSSSPALSRRALLGGLALFCVTNAVSEPARANALPVGASEWLAFRARFVTSDGRIIDTGNGGISHTEGQGVGMLSAALFGEQDDFQLIYDWTERTLKRPYDSLHAWRYRPNAPTPVDDPNNATDGDLLIGLALFLAADRWGSESYRAAGLEIAKDVLRLLVREANGRYVLMPGHDGFDQGNTLIVNPSYYVFPALLRLAQELPDPAWPKLWADGVAMLSEARFGALNLTPDWVDVSRADGSMAPASRWPARFSFDAVRLPLYMCWGGLVDDPVVGSAKAFWSKFGGEYAPAWIDVRTSETASYPQTDGMVSIQRYVCGGAASQAKTLPAVAKARDYYSAALTMLVHVANATRFPAIA
jgi:endo-1,4-beta-D-glucanase Y